MSLCTINAKVTACKLVQNSSTLMREPSSTFQTEKAEIK